MSLNYILSDTLVRIKTAIISHNYIVYVRKTKLISNLLHLFLKEGLILSFYSVKCKNKNGDFYKVFLRKIHLSNLIFIKDIKLISKPSKRLYITHKGFNSLQYSKLLKSYLVVISTSKGLMTARDCMSLGIGGEVLLVIYC